MSQNSLRGNLSATRFPFLSTKMGRSIILPQYDENYDRSVQTTSEDTFGKGIPQLYYMHNVMPTFEGYQSVSFVQQIAGVSGVTNFDRVVTIRDSADNNFLYVPGDGYNYIFNAMIGAWQSTNPFSVGDIYSKTNISYCYLQGSHYLCISGKGVYQYNPSTNTLVAVTFTGLTMPAIKGIATTSGYLICYDDTTIYWSSVTSPLDFVPSLVTGAGSGTPTDIKGKIVTVLQIAGGLMVYSTANTVSGQYTGNIRFPFIFKEVVGSGGIQDAEQVSYTANFSEHYAITSSGIQKMGRDLATTIHDDATDFLACKQYEEFNYTTLKLDRQMLARSVSTKIVLVSDRYLVISYGINPGVFKYAIVFDMALKRWGKLKIDHTDCFEYNWPNLFGTVPYNKLVGRSYASLIGTAYRDLSAQQHIAPPVKSSLAFLQANGSVWTVEFGEGVQAQDSVFIIGKYQMSRNRLFTLHTSVADNLYTDVPYAMYAIGSLDGKSADVIIQGALISNSDLTAEFGFKLTGVNVSLMLMGTFALNSIVLNFTKHGQR